MRLALLLLLLAFPAFGQITSFNRFGESGSASNGLIYATRFVTGTGGANTNYAIRCDWPHVTINGFTNVSLRGIMSATAGNITFPYIVITNGSGSNRTLEFSAVTNRFKWSYAQGAAAPSVLTNGTQLHLSFMVDGTNVVGSYAYYSWP